MHPPARFPFAILALLLAAGPAWALGGDDTPAPAAPAAGEAAAEAPWVAATTGDEVRVRAGPDANYRVLERLPRGSWVVVTGSAGEFRRVRIPGGVPVFVHRDLVASPDGAAAAPGAGKAATAATDGAEPAGAAPAPAVLEVTRSDVLLRPTPGQEFFPLDGQKLQAGARLTVLARDQGDDGAWLKVLPPPEVEYFVHGSLLERVGPADSRRDDLARIEMERRDAYTGGDEAARAAEVEKKLEAAFARLVDDAATALRDAPAGAMPERTAACQEELRQVMTESGDPDLRARASRVAREFVDRARTLEIAAIRAEKNAVKEELERRLAAVEEAHRRAMAEVLKAGPAPRDRRFLAIGTVRRTREGYELVKAGIVLHSMESLRYDLAEMEGMRVGVNGRRIEVDQAHRMTLLRVDLLEILE